MLVLVPGLVRMVVPGLVLVLVLVLVQMRVRARVSVEVQLRRPAWVLYQPRAVPIQTRAMVDTAGFLRSHAVAAVHLPSLTTCSIVAVVVAANAGTTSCGRPT